MVCIKLRTNKEIEEMDGEKFLLCPVCGSTCLSIIEKIKKETPIRINSFGFLDEVINISKTLEKEIESIQCNNHDCKTKYNNIDEYDFVVCYKDNVFYMTKILYNLLTEKAINRLIKIENENISKKFINEYIGLYDKKGKLLKCGDIIKVSDDIVKIIYKYGCFGFESDKTNEFTPLYKLIIDENNKTSTIKL